MHTKYNKENFIGERQEQNSLIFGAKGREHRAWGDFSLRFAPCSLPQIRENPSRVICVLLEWDAD
jgi:hypothetical protein